MSHLLDGAKRAAPVHSSEQRRFVAMLVLDLGLPLSLFYVLRALGADQWTALVCGAVIPLFRVTVTAVVRGQIRTAGLFTLTILAAGTAVGLATADPRLLLARESYLTALIGIWIVATLAARRPMVFTATLPFLPPEAVAAWHRGWDTSAEFRKTLRVMTAAWGVAFMLDAAARIVMAYTLPIDLVPVLSTGLLLGMLILVVAGGKAYGKRHLQGF